MHRFQSRLYKYVISDYVWYKNHKYRNNAIKSAHFVHFLLHYYVKLYMIY